MQMETTMEMNEQRIRKWKQNWNGNETENGKK
jgi:hypothetical protein